jgi:hypothetical protein
MARLDTSTTGDIHLGTGPSTRRNALANHLTPTELADEVDMKRQEVIERCVQMGIPIFHGRIDKTLFMTSLRALSKRTQERAA